MPKLTNLIILLQTGTSATQRIQQLDDEHSNSGYWSVGLRGKSHLQDSARAGRQGARHRAKFRERGESWIPAQPS